MTKVGRRLPEFTVETEGKKYRVSFALASRVRNYGGDLEIARSVSLLDDQFELVMFEGPNSFRYLKYMFGVVTARLSGMQGVTVLRTRDAIFSSPDSSKVHIQLDGEYAGLLPARVEIVPNALSLLVPGSLPRTQTGEREEERMDNLTPLADRSGVEPGWVAHRWYTRPALLLVIAANIPDIDIVTAAGGSLTYFFTIIAA